MRLNKSQSILAYAILTVLMVGAMLVMAGYIKRRVQGSYKKAADVFGNQEQFDAK